MSGNDLADRLDALERTVAGDGTDDSAGDGTGGATDNATDAGSRGVATRSGDVPRLERRVADLEATVEELEAAVQAVRGYAGNVRAVNRDVERRASAALAKAEALETAVGSSPVDTAGRPGESPTASPHRDGDLSREPTVIADSGLDTADGSETDDTDDTDDAVDSGAGECIDRNAGGPDADERAGRNGDGTDTDQFVERVRDAL